jgi:hypothetical protein
MCYNKHMILTIDLDNIPLTFRVLDTPVAKLWVERMALRNQWPLDDAQRFYGFNSQEQDKHIALKKIQECVDNINAWQPLIERSLNQVTDQDTLNYLHNIFEQWHGLLDQQPVHPDWGVIPDDVRQQLANLNICVHRCESSARGNRARFVCTWFGMPKTKKIPLELMQQYGTMNPKFGTVCLNYCEIGKTLEDLTQDRDNYIGDEAFRPFSHYSADFVVRMHEETQDYLSEKLIQMKEYYNQHREFFFDRGYTTFQDPRLLPLRFPVAELMSDLPKKQLIQDIAQQQRITKVTLQ